MDYRQVYTNIIERARLRILDGYGEIHHIYPRCMGGSNHKDNLVKLTAREHFIAHMLLVKINPEKPSLIYAVKMMTRQSSKYRSKNRMYEWLRIKEAKASSKMNTGEGNAFYGKNHTSETKQKLSQIAKERPRKVKPDKKVWTPELLSERQKRAAQTRIKNGTHRRSEESKEKMRQTIAQKPLEMKQGGKKNKGRKLSDDLKEHLSKIRKGKPAHNRGKTVSDIARINIIKGQSVESYYGAELCYFGCGQLAKFKKPSGKGTLMCDSHHAKCPEVKSRKAAKRLKR